MLAASLSPTTGNSDERRVDDALLGLGVRPQHDAGDRHEQQKEREHGEKSVEGDQGGQRSAAVVAVLLQDRDRNRRDRMAALQCVEPAKRPPPEVQRATATGVKVQSRCLIPLMNGESNRSGSPDA